jgi:hypothetical protein
MPIIAIKWSTPSVSTKTFSGDYKHPPLYEEEDMVLDISFVKKYDALRHYKKYIDYKQSD